MSGVDFPAGIIVDEETRRRTIIFFDTVEPQDLERLVKEGICLEATNEVGSVLENASWQGGLKAVNKLLLLGADPCEHTKGSMDSLQSAAFGFSKRHSDHAQIIHKLIAYGADIEHRNDDGRTALHITGGFPIHDDDHYDRIEQCRALLAHGANIYSLSESGERMAIEGQPMAERLPELSLWKKQYNEFVDHKFIPESAQDVCHLLAVYPLKEPQAYVDRKAHLCQIFSHANWQDVKRKPTAQPPEDIIRKLQEDGTISAVIAELLHAVLDNKITIAHGRI